MKFKGSVLDYASQLAAEMKHKGYSLESIKTMMICAVAGGQDDFNEGNRKKPTRKEINAVDWEELSRALIERDNERRRLRVTFSPVDIEIIEELDPIGVSGMTDDEAARPAGIAVENQSKQ